MKTAMTTMERNKMANRLKGTIIAIPLFLVIGLMKLAVVVSTAA